MTPDARTASVQITAKLPAGGSLVLWTISAKRCVADELCTSGDTKDVVLLSFLSRA